MCVHVCVRMWNFGACLCVSVLMYVCMYVRIHTYMYAYVHAYTHINNDTDVDIFQYCVKHKDCSFIFHISQIFDSQKMTLCAMNHCRLEAVRSQRWYLVWRKLNR